MKLEMLIKYTENADVVVVDNYGIKQTYCCDIDVLYTDDDVFDGIYFDDECIIDDSNYDTVRQLQENSFVIPHDNGNDIVFRFYTNTQI